MSKIGYFIDSHDPGGAETIVIELCKGVREFGFEPEVYHFGNPWLEEKCLTNRIPAFFLPGSRFYNSSATIPLFSLVFKQFLERRRVKILHSHLYGPVTGGCIGALLAGIPHVGTLHDVYSLEKRSKVKFVQFSAKLGTRVIAVSHQINGYLRQQGMFSNQSLQTITNGIEIERYAIAHAERNYSALGIRPGDAVFICVGRLEQIKRHDILIQAFSQLKNQSRWKLLIVGDGSCRGDIADHIAREGLERHVTLLGHRDDIPYLLKLSNCFILSSQSEGLSCSIIEAMASGLPIIATNVGGNSELITDDVNGYLVPPGNASILAQKILHIMNQPMLAKKLGLNSFARARSEYSLETMLKKYVANYKDMIAQHN